MPILNSGDLQKEALERLEAAPADPRKMVLYHSLIYAAVTLGALLLTGFLDLRIDHHAGLSGLQARTTLSSLQSLISLLPGVFVLFWTMGYTHSILQAVRGRRTGLETLNEGFFRFGPVIRYSLLEVMITSAMSMLAILPAMLLMLVLPSGAQAFEMAAQGVENGLVSASGAVDPALGQAMTRELMPVIVLYFVTVLLLTWAISYPLRMAPYFLMDGEKTGAIQALSGSFQCMRGRWGQLLKLDFSFWWYYLLLGLAAGVTYLDLILPMMGVELALDPRIAGMITGGLGVAMLTAVNIAMKNRVTAAYALFYEKIKDAPKTERPRKANPWAE